MDAHPAAFWFILIGGLLTVAGLVLTALSLWAIRRAVISDAASGVRIYGSTAKLRVTVPVPAVSVGGEPPTVDQRVAALEARLAAMPDEWIKDIHLLVNETSRGVEARIGPQIADAMTDIRKLVAPLTKDWRLAGYSAALLAVGVAAQTVGSLLAL